MVDWEITLWPLCHSHGGEPVKYGPGPAHYANFLVMSDTQTPPALHSAGAIGASGLYEPHALFIGIAAFLVVFLKILALPGDL